MRADAHRLGWDLRVIGIGEHATTRAVESLTGGGPVLLAGTAGALDRGLSSGTAHLVREVWTHEGVLISPLVQSGLRVTGADTVIATPQDKLDLCDRTGAQLVDMESHAFARAARARGLDWAVVRGVSDAVDHHMPANAHRWFTADGGLRPLRAGWDLVRHPSDVPRLRAFMRRGHQAMLAVRSLILDRWGARQGIVR